LDQFSDSEWDVPEDPPELQEARKKLDMHTSCVSQGVYCVHMYLQPCHGRA